MMFQVGKVSTGLLGKAYDTFDDFLRLRLRGFWFYYTLTKEIRLLTFLVSIYHFIKRCTLT